MAIHVPRYIKTLIVLVCLIGAVTFIHYALRIHNTAKQLATVSYVSSVHAFLQVKATKTNVVIEIGENLTEEWRFLNEQEYIKLAKAMSKLHSIDRGRLSHEPSEILFDHWNRHILIAGRKRHGWKPEYIVWSKGRDRILGTQDDISSPWCSVVPAGLRE